MITLRLPYPSPPLRSNDRMHWARKAKLVKEVRSTARIGAIVHSRHTFPTPLDQPVTITLIWEVTNKRRRDVGAAAPTLKAAIDGLVDARLLRGDSHEWVTEERLRIEVGDKPGVRLEIAVNDNSAGQMTHNQPNSDIQEGQ